MTMQFANEALLCRYLQQRYNRLYRHADILPLPYCADARKARAIVLGTDPSNPKGVFVERVFGLENPDSPYFRTIFENLKQIGLSTQDVYVQNLCKNYFRIVASANPYWAQIAVLWRGRLKEELDGLFDRRIPVLITSKDLVPVLAVDLPPIRPSDLYRKHVAIAPTENYLGRTIIPFFRHWFYSLEKWGEYREWVKSMM